MLSSWIVANAIAGSVIGLLFALVLPLAQDSRNLPEALRSIPTGSLLMFSWGLLFAIIQAVVFRGSTYRVVLWLLVTGAGLVGAMVSLGAFIDTGNTAFLLAVAASSPLLGCIQLAILIGDQWHFNASVGIWWVVSSALGSMFLVASLASLGIYLNSRPSLVVGLVAGAAVGTAYGLMTKTALARLLLEVEEA